MQLKLWYDESTWRCSVDGRRCEPGEQVAGRPVDEWVARAAVASRDREYVRAAGGFLSRLDGWRHLAASILSAGQRGVAKHFTAAQLDAARERLKLANAARAAKRAARLAK